MLVKMCRAGLMALLASAALAFGGERRIAFERDDAVYIAKLDGTLIKKVAEGISPAISPDALHVAFTTVEKSGASSARHIAVVEIATGNTIVFKDVPSDNSYYPTWSPDGKWIAFSLRSDDLWHLGMIKVDGTAFNFIKKGAQREATLYASCWARDGVSIFCQDLTNVYRLGLNGIVLAKWNVEKIIPNGDMSSDGRIDVSPDGKRLLLSIDMAEEHNRKDWDGPLPALWSFDLTTQRAVRLSSKNLFAWDGCWLDNDNILFLSQSTGEKSASVYRMSVDRKNLKRLIKDARRPSVSAP
jgi:TolB protein